MQLFYAIGFAAALTLILHVILIIRKKRKEATIAALKAKVWKVFSIYIRSREADFRDNVACFTCGKVDHWKTMDAGHYIPKSTGGSALYFHEKNVHPQCTGCNRFRHGNLTLYALNLQKRYGNSILAELHALRGRIWNKKELERLLVHYTFLTRKITNPTVYALQPGQETSLRSNQKKPNKTVQ